VSLPHGDAANDIWGPDIIALCVEDFTWLEQKPKEVKGSSRGSKLMTLLFTTDLIAEVIVKEFEENVDMLRCSRGVIRIMGQWLVILVTGELLSMMVEDPVRGIDLDRLAVKADVRIVGYYGLKGIDKVI
jgi:hypothetical protein